MAIIYIGYIFENIPCKYRGPISIIKHVYKVNGIKVQAKSGLYDENNCV